MEMKRPRRAKTILKKNKFGGLTYLLARFPVKLLELRQCGFSTKIDIQINVTDIESKIRATCIYDQQIFDKGAKVIQ